MLDFIDWRAMREITEKHTTGRCTVEALRGPRKTRATLARRNAAIVEIVAAGYSQTKTAKFFRRDQQTISNVLKRART
jgi:DNA-binding CsgD family transcriptional regulator